MRHLYPIPIILLSKKVLNDNLWYLKRMSEKPPRAENRKAGLPFICMAVQLNCIVT